MKNSYLLQGTVVGRHGNDESPTVVVHDIYRLFNRNANSVCGILYFEKKKTKRR